MLSILIPVYNFKVVKLVKALMRQCKRLDIDYEILVFDDGSRKKIRHENSVLSGYFGVNYTELSENLGRARIRNWMAKSAGFDTLLFLDCDSKIIGKDFIKTYLASADNADVVCGGRVYSPKAPRAKTKRLHWYYGKRRESRKATVRNKESYIFFHSNNFLARRDVVLEIPFEEDHSGYGYEDLLWAKKLLDNHFTILHIDNPVEHLGLERADVFLKKSKESITNLKRLRREYPELETRLTRIANKLRNLGIKKRLYSCLVKKEDPMYESLNSASISLWKLDLLKLLWYWRGED